MGFPALPHRVDLSGPDPVGPSSSRIDRARRVTMADVVRPTAGTWALVILITVMALWIRRPDQFAHPYIWVEDGALNLKAFAERGLRSALEPVAGYYGLAMKLVTLTAFKLSIRWAPEIAVALVAGLTCGVVISIALAPTYLPWRPICALMPLLVPTDSEVFAVSAFASWWAGLWVILALLWDGRRGYLALRLMLLLLGGFSSPIVIPLSVLFALRALIERTRSEWISGAVALIIALAQGLSVYRLAELNGTAAKFILPVFIGRFFGDFVTPWMDIGAGLATVGEVILALIVLAVLVARRRIDRYFVLLAAMFFVICLTTVLRVPVEVIHPFLAGPRYFFYPFTILAWILIWLAAVSNFPVRLVLLAVLAAGIGQALPEMPRHQDFIDWRAELANCAESDEYDLPIHVAGSLSDMWHVHLTGAQCGALIRHSLIR